jgi:serine protease Do
MIDPVRYKGRVIVFTTAAFLGGVLFASGVEWTTGMHAATLLQQPTTPDARAVQPVADLSHAFVTIAEAVTPGVVNIATKRERGSVRGHPQVPEQFRRFFDLPEGEDVPDVPMEGGGTGFLITPDGYIVTNNHVVEGADEIRVTLHDRRQMEARVVGRDPTTDIAVLKVEGSSYPTLRMGRSDDVRVGEWVLAVGNPLGLDFTVTSGIVSAKGRPLGILPQSLQRSGQEDYRYAIEDFIQTDAAINPGNSGGPLINLRGEVIGVNSAIASRTGFSQGYGFAVPADLVRRVADDLIRYGRTRRPVLGVQIQAVTPEDAEAFRLPKVAGVVVQDFPAESPAKRAGLQSGDVIVAVDGKPVEQSNELQRVIAMRQPGEAVTLDVIRYGEPRQFKVALAEAPADAVAPPRQTAAAPAARPSDQRLGIQVEPLTAERAKELRYSGTDGVVVTAVQRGGVAAQRGLSRGDRIVEVDREAVRDAAHFRQVMTKKQPGSVVSLLREQPGGARSIVNVRLPG